VRCPNIKYVELNVSYSVFNVTDLALAVQSIVGNLEKPVRILIYAIKYIVHYSAKIQPTAQLMQNGIDKMVLSL